MPVRPLLLHRMALVSFRLYVSEKFGQLARIFWANGLPPPLAKNFPYAYANPADFDKLEGCINPFYKAFVQFSSHSQVLDYSAEENPCCIFFLALLILSSSILLSLFDTHDYDLSCHCLYSKREQ